MQPQPLCGGPSRSARTCGLNLESTKKECLHSFSRCCCGDRIVTNRRATCDTSIAPSEGLPRLEIDDFSSGTLLSGALICCHRVRQGKRHGVERVVEGMARPGVLGQLHVFPRAT